MTPRPYLRASLMSAVTVADHENVGIAEFPRLRGVGVPRGRFARHRMRAKVDVQLILGGQRHGGIERVTRIWF